MNQEELSFKACLGQWVRPCLNIKTNKKNNKIIKNTRDIAQLAECMTSIHKSQGLLSSTAKKTDIAVRIYNLSIPEVQCHL